MATRYGSVGFSLIFLWIFSWLFLCNDIANAQTSTITIAKNATPADGTDFSFTSDFGNFTLDDANPDDADAVGESITFQDIAAGIYEFVEIQPNSWYLKSIVCIHNSNSSGTVVDAIRDGDSLIGVSIQLATEGDEITCTFNNEELPSSTITIAKNAAPADGTDFSFSSGLGDFMLDEANPDDADAVDERITFQVIAAGTYGFVETLPRCWSLNTIVCTYNSIDTVVDAILDNDSVIGVSIEPAPDDEIMCTFNNLRVPIGEDTDQDGFDDCEDNCPDTPNPGQTDGDRDWVGDVCDNCPATPNPDQADSDQDGIGDYCDPCPFDNPNDSDGDGVCDSVDICPGFDDAIDSDEDDVPDGCDPCPFDNPDDSDSDGVCDTDDVCPGSDDTIDSDRDGVTDGCDNCPVTPNPGQENADNDGLGDACDNTIIIEKRTVPTNGTGFGFADNIETPNSFTLDDGQSQIFSNLAPGAYTVTEEDPGGLGYKLTDLVCRDSDAQGTATKVILGDRTATINLDPGETVTCTFTNTQLGACCVGNGTAPSADTVEQINGQHECNMKIESECNSGHWNPTLTCEENTCNPTPGACLSEDQSCDEVPLIDCPADQWVGGPCPQNVPTITEWGVIVLSLLLIGSAIWFIRRRKRTS